MSGASAPAWQQVEARVILQRDCGAGHRWLELALPAGFGMPEPGQFVQLLLAAPSPVLLPRPMSVAAAAGRRGARRLGFLYQPVGTGTHALAALEPGARVEVLGPLGRGFPLAEPGAPVLVAGGRGVAPLLFAAEWLSRRGRRCTFLFGARGRAQLVQLREARARLRRAGGRLVAATIDGSAGFHGDVVELLRRAAPRLPSPLVVHACGPHPMLKAVAQWALEHAVPAYLAMESVMACGTGVCRGCPLPRSAAGARRRARGSLPSLFGNRDYAMTCTEGPVFEAGELDWERVV
jgi:dihydroorotate dehydrogenase electron transfer subunit